MVHCEPGLLCLGMQPQARATARPLSAAAGLAAAAARAAATDSEPEWPPQLSQAGVRRRLLVACAHGELAG